MQLRPISQVASVVIQPARSSELGKENAIAGDGEARNRTSATTASAQQSRGAALPDRRRRPVRRTLVPLRPGDPCAGDIRGMDLRPAKRRPF